MKWYYSLAFLFLFHFSCFGQKSKEVKISIGLGYCTGVQGYALPSQSTGVLFHFEPYYPILNNLDVGIRFEAAFSKLLIASYGINCQYYFSNKSFRPFIGVGMGFYHPSFKYSYQYPQSQFSTDEETKIGIYPRIGFGFKRFKLTTEYNFVGTSKVTIYGYGAKSTGYLNGSYFCLKVGYILHAGRLH